MPTGWTPWRSSLTCPEPMRPTLIILAGPTASGKTDAAIRMAKHWGTAIISCDSRQMYKEMSIGTAKPDTRQLEAVRHYLINHLSIHDYYSAFRFRQDAIRILDGLFEDHPVVVMTGGTGLYMDAIVNGIDDIPDPDPVIRNILKQRYQEKGLESLLEELSELDPEYFRSVDQKNPARVIRGLEVCLTTGRTFSSFRIRQPAERNFDIVLASLELPREILYERIDRRVDLMLAAGLEEEARTLYPDRELNALNTVGYRELFGWFDGKYDREEAIRLIRRNTRHYAKRQITWNRRYGEMKYVNPDGLDEWISRLDRFLGDRDKNLL
jgi:tRNA dimethylallyltransferase